jgi:Glycine-zipper domain
LGWVACSKDLSVSYPSVFCVSPAADAPLPAQPHHRLQLRLVGGKSYETFQRDDQYCQSSAQQAIGYQSPGQAANQAAVGTAAVGTALGAVAGAAIGSVSGNMGTGAALGAGTGLVAGSAIGAGNGDAAGGSLQVRYDTVYAQCMTAKGNRIGGPPVAELVYVYPPPYYWGPGSRKRRSARR